MKKILNVLMFLLVIVSLTYVSDAKEIKFWGKQIRGTGPGKNAQIKGSKLVVKTRAKIVKVDGYGNYCIWKEGVMRGYLCSSKQSDLVGKKLPQGKYTIFPSLKKHKYSATTTITVDCNDCYIEN